MWAPELFPLCPSSYLSPTLYNTSIKATLRIRDQPPEIELRANLAKCKISKIRIYGIEFQDASPVRKKPFSL